MKNYAKKCEICGDDVYPQNEVNNGVGIETSLNDPRVCETCFNSDDPETQAGIERIISELQNLPF